MFGTKIKEDLEKICGPDEFITEDEEPEKEL